MPHPSPKNHDLLYNWLYEHAGRTPYWQFPDRMEAPGVVLERLTFDNYHGVPALFDEDDSPFLEKRFLSLSSLHEYVGFLMAVFPYSVDHGGVDYLVRTPDGDLAGLVHLYDLSREPGQRHRAYVGFQVGRKFRGGGLAHRAVSLLEDYAVQERKMTLLLADTYEENTRSIRFLERRGYVFLSSDRGIRTYGRREVKE